MKCIKAQRKKNVGERIEWKINIRVALSTPTVFLYLRNAAFLVLVVIIKLTRRRQEGIGVGGLEEERLEWRSDRTGSVWRDLFEPNLRSKTFRFHSATCSCIVELREAVTRISFLNRDFLRIFSVTREKQQSCGGGGGVCCAPFCMLKGLSHEIDFKNFD